MRRGFKSLLLAGIALVLANGPTLAQVGITYTNLGVSLTTATTNCLRPGNYRAVIMQNVSGGNVGYCYRSAPATACTPAIGSAGTFTLAAGATQTWPLNNAPRNGLDCTHASSGDLSVVAGQ